MKFSNISLKECRHSFEKSSLNNNQDIIQTFNLLAYNRLQLLLAIVR